MRFVSGMAIGAGLAYLLDPQRGRGRRAVARDKARHLVREGKDLLETGLEDLGNRAHGLRARARHPLKGHRNPGQRMELLQENWSPGTRLIMGAAGMGLAIWGLARRGLVCTLAGAGLFARAAANRPIRRVIGLEKGRLVDVHKTITVHAPRDQVYRFWRAFENFPRFMQHVRDVRVDGNRSHWTVSGPAGMNVEWDADLLSDVEGEEICWSTVAGAQVMHEGAIKFQDAPDGGTRIDIRMTYDPPAGVLGHVVASLFHTDPKHAMDDDLVRMKSLLEQGKTRAHHERVTRDELLEH